MQIIDVVLRTHVVWRGQGRSHHARLRGHAVRRWRDPGFGYRAQVNDGANPQFGEFGTASGPQSAELGTSIQLVALNRTLHQRHTPKVARVTNEPLEDPERASTRCSRYAVQLLCRRRLDAGRAPSGAACPQTGRGTSSDAPCPRTRAATSGLAAGTSTTELHPALSVAKGFGHA